MIRKYENKDFNQINIMTESFWKDEFKMSKDLQSFIYKFLVKYYLYDNDMTYVYEEDDNILAFMLAHQNNEVNNAINYFNNNVINLCETDQLFAIKYLEYIEYNHKMVKEIMPDDSIYLGLIASQKKGAGKELINHLIDYSNKNNLGEIYLWTDETCNYKYYEKMGFNLKKDYEINFFDRKIKTFIYSISNTLKNI